MSKASCLVMYTRARDFEESARFRLEFAHLWWPLCFPTWTTETAKFTFFFFYRGPFSPSSFDVALNQSVGF